MSSKLNRRQFIKWQLGGAAGLALGSLVGSSCSGPSGARGQKLIALGLDGMDPHLTSRMMNEGKLPTFTKLARDGVFGGLRTSDPPQSPVAWANFIAGANPGRHGIYDFVHRDPDTYLPFLSTSKAEPAEDTITIGDVVIPLSSGTAENLRQGRAFWEVLADHEIPATIFRIPSNFPPTEGRQRTFSGMGTPDVLGTYGIFSYFTDQPPNLDSTLGGGEIYKVEVVDNTVRGSLVGPENSFRVDAPPTKVDFVLHLDPVNPTARLTVQDTELLLVEREWSPWVQVTFDFFAGFNATGICRFYLREAHPHFKLYVTPINIDPSDPLMPISTPEDYANELARKFGPFHTKGLPADTKALDQGVLDDDDFLSMDDLFLEENLAIFEHELARFEEGLLFYYISSTDQRAHMFWRLTDSAHPSYDEKQAARLGGTIEAIYRRMDELLDNTLSRIDDRTLLLAFSDHGFAPFYRSFNLNSWLRDAGYLKLKSGDAGDDKTIFRDVDWSKTKAYAIGFNALYINERGREGEGSVAPTDKPGLAEEIAARLQEIRDPETGGRVVQQARPAPTCYSGNNLDYAPDVVVGYGRGFRASWQTALGSIPNVLYEWNKNKWSGDHCMDASQVPGIFLANRPVKRGQKVSLCDLTATVLDHFGVQIPGEMDGESIL